MSYVRHTKYLVFTYSPLTNNLHTDFFKLASNHSVTIIFGGQQCPRIHPLSQIRSGSYHLALVLCCSGYDHHSIPRMESGEFYCLRHTFSQFGDERDVERQARDALASDESQIRFGRHISLNRSELTRLTG